MAQDTPLDTRARRPGSGTVVKRAEQFGLIVVWLLLIALFGYLRPETFLTWPNFSTILGSQAVLVVITLGLIIPLTANDFDLSIAFLMTLSSMTIAVLNVNYGIGIGWAVLAALALGLIVGLINGLLITVFRIHSLIVTLGTGTFLHGFTLWMSDSMTISGISTSLINAVIVDRLFGIPLEFYYAIGLAFVIWYLLDYTALGRRILFVGRGRDVARLSGINTDRIRIACLMVSGLFGALAGALYAGTQGAADPVSGVTYQLPAFAAAFLGSTSIVPGRFNPWGATVAVYFLVTGITGLVFLGFSSFIQEMFYGGALVVAVCLSQLVRGRQEQQFWQEHTVIPRSLDRDFVGYGPNPPDPRWPGGARLALNFVLNYEEGSEYSMMDKDGVSDAALTEIPAAAVPRGERDLAAESMFEYGSRVGFWRLHRLFQERGLPMTVYACALALERNAPAAEAIQAAGYDICCHGWRWVEHFKLSEETEREHIRLAVESLQRTVGQRPSGWYCRYGPSVNTRRLVIEEGGFLYDSDSYADDLPYYVMAEGRPQLVIPYTLTNNDLKWGTGNLGSGEDFFVILREAFDVLYKEGRTAPKMMNVGMHMRLLGHPSRASGLAKFLDYVKATPDVWVAKRLDIAKHWLATHPCETSA